MEQDEAIFKRKIQIKDSQRMVKDHGAIWYLRNISKGCWKLYNSRA